VITVLEEERALEAVGKNGKIIQKGQRGRKGQGKPDSKYRAGKREGEEEWEKSDPKKGTWDEGKKGKRESV